VVRLMVMTGMVMVVVVMMAGESRHGDHDHHQNEERQQLLHGPDYSHRMRSFTPGPATLNHARQQANA